MKWWEKKKRKEEELIANPNPFAIVVLANLYTLKTVNDLEKRLLFKEKVYEIARLRQYPIDKIAELLIFVKDLMLLSPILENEYNNFIIKQKKVEEMRVLSPNMREFMHTASLELFGESMLETRDQLQAALKVKDDALKVKDDALKVKDDALKREDDALKIITRSILNLKDKMNLNAEQIASILDVDVDFVNDILSKTN